MKTIFALILIAAFIAMVRSLWPFLFSKRYNEEEQETPAVINPTPAQQYYGQSKPEEKAPKKTGSYFFANSKSIHTYNKKQRNRSRAKIQRETRKVNFGLC